MKTIKILYKPWLITLSLSAVLTGCGGSGNHVNSADSYTVTNLVANSAIYHPQIIEPDLQDAWGVSLRPAGAGGHWWVVANKTGKSIEYVGDVNGKPLQHDPALVEVTVPNHGGTQGTPTGTVFNPSGTGFVIDQTLPNGKGTVHAPAKFFFSTDAGVIAAWTQRTNADGTIDYPLDSVIKWDESDTGAAYFGMAISSANDRLYVADFGQTPKVLVLNSQFQDISAGRFPNPFPGFAPYNCQAVGTSIFVAYSKQEVPGEEAHGIGLGKLAEFDSDGKLITVWDDRNLLNAPWGITLAPAGFGLYSGKLLVANFGNGTVTVFDPATHEAIDYLRGSDKKPLIIDGIWDLKFGNGVTLGEANALYFSAGPNGEQDGVFGKIKSAS